MFILKNNGQIRNGENRVINGAVLNSSQPPAGVDILVGIDTMGGIYLLNRAAETCAVFVREMRIHPNQAFYLNAPEFDRIEIATGAGSYFLHFRRVQKRDVENTAYAALPPTHVAHLSRSECPHDEPLGLADAVPHV